MNSQFNVNVKIHGHDLSTVARDDGFGKEDNEVWSGNICLLMWHASSLLFVNVVQGQVELNITCGLSWEINPRSSPPTTSS